MEVAVEHAIAAGDRAWAATMLVRSWNEFARVGEFQTLERLIATIGDAGTMAGPLAIVEGWRPVSWARARASSDA